MQIAFVWRMREVVMLVRLPTFLVRFGLGSALFFSGASVHAQSRISLKSGESTQLILVYQVVNCTSIVVGNPEVEMLEGPEELTLEIKKENVVPRRQNCAKPVPGGTLILTAKEIKERKDAKLTYRIKFKTKQGDRQQSGTYDVSLFP
jgi:hypothetical protein